MKASFLENPFHNKRALAPVAVLLAGVVLASQQQTNDKVISIGDVTCQGVEQMQIEQNTPVDTVVNRHKASLGIDDQDLTNEHQRNFRTIILKRIIDEESEAVLVEQPTKNGNTELLTKYTITADLPAECSFYKHLF